MSYVRGSRGQPQTSLVHTMKALDMTWIVKSQKLKERKSHDASKPYLQRMQTMATANASRQIDSKTRLTTAWKKRMRTKESHIRQQKH